MKGRSRDWSEMLDGSIFPNKAEAEGTTNAAVQEHYCSGLVVGADRLRRKIIEKATEEFQALSSFDE